MDSSEDTIGDLKKLIAAQIGTKPEKIVLKKSYNVYKDQITLADCKYIFISNKIDEIQDGSGIELYYQ